MVRSRVAAVLFISERQSANLPMYIGAIFADIQPLPDLGAWHGSECKSPISCISYLYSELLVTISYNYHHTYYFIIPILFGTYSTSTASEAELSQSLQTAFANFAKNQDMVSPVPDPVLSCPLQSHLYVLTLAQQPLPLPIRSAPFSEKVLVFRYSGMPHILSANIFNV